MKDRIIAPGERRGNMKMYKYVYIIGSNSGALAILRADTDEQAIKRFKEKIGDYQIKNMEPFDFDMEPFYKL